MQLYACAVDTSVCGKLIDLHAQFKTRCVLTHTYPPLPSNEIASRHNGGSLIPRPGQPRSTASKSGAPSAVDGSYKKNVVGLLLDAKEKLCYRFELSRDTALVSKTQVPVHQHNADEAQVPREKVSVPAIEAKTSESMVRRQVQLVRSLVLKRC